MDSIINKEFMFLNALIADYNLKNDNSFLSVLFECHPFDNNMKPYFYDEINETFKDSYKKIIFDSDILFVMRYSTYFGKYKDYFWVCDEDGNLSYIGKSIDDIIYTAFSFWTGNFFDERQKEDRILDIENKGFNYDNILNDYQSFCKVYGYDFHYDYLPDLIGEKEFNEIIK